MSPFESRMPQLISGLTFLNQYVVEEFIVRTPLGGLYRATDNRNNKPLALTLLPKNISENPESLKELEVRSNQLRGLFHPNIVPHLGLYQTPILAFVLEDWIDGPSLKNIVGHAPVGINESLIYTKAICGALEALHKNKYLHLNLSPELIHIDKRGKVYISGLAFSRPIGDKFTDLSGKYPHLYFAPEQFSTQPLTTATDIYALAVLIYMLNTGRWINGKSAPTTPGAIRKAHLELLPPAPILFNPGIPDHFSRMILWALRKKPEDRLKSTIELLSSLTLAARTTPDAVPLQIGPETAPVTSAILAAWEFLTPSKPAFLAQETPPLKDRLPVQTTTQSRNKTGRIGFISVLVFIMIASFISLFLIVRPEEIQIPTPLLFTPFAADYTPPPTSTALPKPTDPHGGRIAFTCTRGDLNQLCMINRDGTGLAQLTDMDASNYYPVFTPDGGSLLFSSNRNGSFDLYLLLFGEKQILQLTKNVGNVVSPDYSPDGRRIVFANRASDGPTSIWMVNADGLNPHLVYAGPNTIVATAWSPDGQKIAYAMSMGIPQEYEIYTMDSNGKNHIRISRGLKGIGGSLDWSPDGKYLLIYAGPFGDKNIFKLDAETGDETRLTDGGNNAGASYSPDGQYIVFNSLRNDDQADLYIMRANGANQVQLTNDPQPDWGPQWVE